MLAPSLDIVKTKQKKTKHFSLFQLPLTSSMKPSDLVAAAMKLKVEASEEKEIADRTIQEQITAHQLNAVQQQVGPTEYLQTYLLTTKLFSTYKTYQFNISGTNFDDNVH